MQVVHEISKEDLAKICDIDIPEEFSGPDEYVTYARLQGCPYEKIKNSVTMQPNQYTSPHMTYEIWLKFQKGLVEILATMPEDSFCDISTHFIGSPKYPSPNSASMSIILFGQIKVPVTKRIVKNSVVVKLSFSETDPSIDNSLSLEISIYESVVIKKLYNLPNVTMTPHIVMYMGYFECPNILSTLPALAAKGNIHAKNVMDRYKEMSNPFGDGKTLNNLFSRRYKPENMRWLVLEKTEGLTLSTWLRTNTSLDGLPIILFQIIYTLGCFDKIGLMHNDLHMGNIFIDRMPKVYSVAYVVNNTAYKLTTDFHSKVYDFDRAEKFSTPYSTNSTRNTVLDLFDSCTNLGQCHKFTPGYDLVKFLSSMRTHIRPSSLAKFYNMLPPNIKLKNLIEEYGLNQNTYNFPCKQVQGGPCVLEDLSGLPRLNEYLTHLGNFNGIEVFGSVPPADFVWSMNIPMEAPPPPAPVII